MDLTTQDEIQKWFEDGVKQGKKYMLVLCDTFDWSDYPMYFESLAGAARHAANPGSMQKYMESYDLTSPMQPQLDATRSHVI